MNNDKIQQTEKQTRADANPADIGVVVAGPVARSLVNDGDETIDPTLDDVYWITEKRLKRRKRNSNRTMQRSEPGAADGDES